MANKTDGGSLSSTLNNILATVEGINMSPNPVSASMMAEYVRKVFKFKCCFNY